jgi:LemA protein
MIWALFAFIILIYSIAVYNRFIFLDNITNNARIQIDINIKLRNDLIPLLTGIVRKYSDYEKTALGEITSLREGNNSMKKIFARLENYPKLKADKSFLMLQKEISRLESNIAFKRQFYNDAVFKYNNLAMSFPSNIISKIFGFKNKESFGNDSEFLGGKI